ncbi:polysaccharide biosynthesis protein [bacterium BMS3Bbin10]|nr:polysaccharide biosynthesis protein [bacterium BMS3Bbin10]
MSILRGGKLMSKSVGLTGVRVAGAGAGFMTQLLLARTMAPADLGLFYIFSSMAIVLGTVAAIGYPGIANQFIVRYKARGKKRSLRAFVRTARRDTFIASIFVAIFCVAAVAIGSGGNPEIIWPTVIAALAIPAFTTLRVSGGFANAVERFALSFLPDNLIRPVLFLAIMAIIVSVNGSLGLLPVVGVFAALSVAVAAMQTWAVGWSGGIAGSAATPHRRLTRHWRMSGGRLVIPLLITSLFADLSILGAGFMLEPAEVAIFGLCVKIAFMSGFFVQVVHQIAIPRFARSALTRNQADTNEVIFQTNAIAAGAMALALLLAWLGGSEFLALFGDEFPAGYTVLLILVGTQLVRALGGPALSLLIASGLHGRSLHVMVASLAVFVGSFFALAPSLGLTGAALAVLAGSALSSAGLAVVVRRELGYRCDILAFLQPNPSPEVPGRSRA